MLSEQERRFLQLVQDNVDLDRLIGPDVLLQPYTYPLLIGQGSDNFTPNPLVNGVTQSGIITIQADAFFMLKYIETCVVLPTGSTDGGTMFASPANNVSLQITDTGAGHDLFNQATPAGLVTGTPWRGCAGVPYMFSHPRLIPPNTNIKVEATQLGLTALTNPQPLQFWIMLAGVKVFLNG